MRIKPLLRPLILLGLLFGTMTVLALPGSRGIGDDYFPNLGNGGYDVQHYALTLDVDMDENTIDGSAEITLLTTQELSRFTLEFAEFRVENVTIDGDPTPVQRNRGEFMVQPFTPLVAEETYTLTIDYSGTPSGGWRTYDGGVLVFGEPTGASGWYPVNEHPLDKATYTLEITVDDEYDVAANGIREQIEAPEGKVAYRFEPEAPMASYLVTVSIGQFDRVTQETADGLTIRNYFAETLGQQYRSAFDRTPEMIDYFESLFGPYPFESYGVVVHDIPFGAALETQTLSTFGITLANERVAAHELAHQWFGNSVSLADWSDVWLNEGFASYAEILWIERQQGQAAAERALRRWYENMATSVTSLGLDAAGLADALSDAPFPGDTLSREEVAAALDALLEGVLSADERADLAAEVGEDGIADRDILSLIRQADFPETAFRPSHVLDFLEAVGMGDMLSRESLPPVPGDPGPERLFSRVVYERGALTLHALRLEVGDETFFDILRTYAERYDNGNVRTGDFIAIAEELHGESLRDLFEPWLLAPEIPDMPALDLSWEDFQ